MGLQLMRRLGGEPMLEPLLREILNGEHHRGPARPKGCYISKRVVCMNGITHLACCTSRECHSHIDAVVTAATGKF